MKRVLPMLCSILLVLACLFGIFACLEGMKDIQNIQDYKNADAEGAKAGLAAARDGIELLEENEFAYTTGVGEFEDGKVQLKDGKKQLESGSAALRAGEASVASGQAQIDANTQAYNEGKATLEKIQPIMPYVNMYITFRDNNLTNIAGFSDAQTWFVSVVKPVAAENGLEIPDNVNDLPGYVQATVADAESQLKQYEDGVAALEDGKQALAAGYAQQAAGQQSLKDGEKQLKEGDAQLTEYEEGQATLAKGMYELLDGMGSCRTRSGKLTVPSLKSMLGDDHSIYKLNADGSKVKYRDCDFVDIDACSLLCDKAEEYLNLQGSDIKSELYSRIAVYGIAALACIFGIIAGIFGFVASITGGVKTGKRLGIICAVLALAANIVGLFTNYTGYVYPTRSADNVLTYSGDIQLIALILLSVIAIIFVVVSSSSSKKAKRTHRYQEYIEMQNLSF